MRPETLTRTFLPALLYVASSLSGCGNSEPAMAGADRGVETTRDGASEVDLGDMPPGGPDGHAELPDGQEQLYDAPRPEDTVTPPRYPETVSTCGQPPYSWVSPATMGEVVDYEYMPEWSLSKELMALAIVAAGLDGVIEATYGVDIYRVRFTTQNLGEPIEATGVLAVPQLEDDDATETHAVVIMGPTSGFTDICAGSATDANARAATVYATQGQIVMVPDYIGKTSMGGDGGRIHPYLVSEASAMVGWDGLRAGLSVLSDEGRPARHDGRVVLWGASQGGHAVYAVERYAPYYAPEFELIAAVTLIAPGDLLSQTEDAFLEYGTTARGVLISLITLGDWYGLWPRISEVIRDDDAFPIASWLRAEMEKVCYPELEDLGVDSLDDLFTPDFLAAVIADDWTGFEDWRCILEATSPLSYYLPRVNDTPMLQVLSESDTLVDLKVERETFRQLCDSGYRIEQLVCDNAGHTEGPGWSLTEQFSWIADRVAGLPLENPCIAAAPTCCSETPEGTCDEPRTP